VIHVVTRDPAGKEKQTMNTTDTTATPTVAPAAPSVAPLQASPAKTTTRQQAATQAPTRANAKKQAKAKAKAPAKKAAKAPEAAGPRPGSKGAAILALLQRKGGSTLASIMSAAGWQAHSVRGFLSTAAKKYGVVIESSRRQDGQRVYSIT
jgi:hypothetical protein